MKNGSPILLVAAMAVLLSVPAFAQSSRKIKDQVPPTYPEMAKSMHLVGSVKIQVTITPQGNVTNAKVLGGHPLLADSALKAVQRWKYEPGAEETQIVVVDFKKNE